MKTMTRLSKATRTILSFIPILLICSQLKAQTPYPVTKFGIKFGANANSWTNQFPAAEFGGNLIFPDDWKTTYGFHGGVFLNIRLSKLIALEPALLYTQKGTGTILDAGGVNIEGTINSNYLDIPFILRIYAAKGFNLFLGPQLSYHLSSNFDLTADDTIVIDGEDTSDTISELDMAAVLGIGYEFDSGVNINLAGELGFLTVDGIGDLSTFNRNIRLSLGFSF